MGTLTVRVRDVTGNRQEEVEVPDDVPVNRILVLLVEKMGMPREGWDGQLISYRFHHHETGRQLLADATLEESGVGEGDTLRLQPEITAGGS